MDKPRPGLHQAPQSLTALLLSFSGTPIPDPIPRLTKDGEREGCGLACVEEDEQARASWSGREQDYQFSEAIADPIPWSDESLSGCQEDSSRNGESDQVQSCEASETDGQCSGSKHYFEIDSAHHSGGSDSSAGDGISASPMGHNQDPQSSSRGAESTTPIVPEIPAASHQSGPEQSSWRRRYLIQCGLHV